MTTPTPAVEPAAKLTVREAAKRLGIDPESVRAGIDRGELPGVHVGDRYHVYRDAIDALVRGEWSAATYDKAAERIAQIETGQLPESPFLRRVERIASAS